MSAMICLVVFVVIGNTLIFIDNLHFTRREKLKEFEESLALSEVVPFDPNKTIIHPGRKHGI